MENRTRIKSYKQDAQPRTLSAVGVLNPSPRQAAAEHHTWRETKRLSPFAIPSPSKPGRLSPHAGFRGDACRCCATQQPPQAERFNGYMTTNLSVSRGRSVSAVLWRSPQAVITPLMPQQ